MVFPPDLSYLQVQFKNSVSAQALMPSFSVITAGGLHEFADPQFCHILAYGEDRGESRKNMIVALKELSICGDFMTTVKHFVTHLELEAFKINTITTGWLDPLIGNKLAVECLDATLVVISGASPRHTLRARFLLRMSLTQCPASTSFTSTLTIFSLLLSSTTIWTLYLNGSSTIYYSRRSASCG